MNRSWLFLVCLVLAGCSSPPDFYDTNGKGYRYDQLDGWVVINYWATWCAPCIKEIPELAALGDNHDNIHVFGVNFDAPEGEEIQRSIDKLKITFPVFAEDPYRQLGIDRPEVLPTTLLIAPDGQIRETLVGPQTEATLLAAMGL